MKNRILPIGIILFISLFLAIANQAQTVIRDKITINPGSIKGHLKDNLTSHDSNDLCTNFYICYGIGWQQDEVDEVWHGELDEADVYQLCFYRDTEFSWSVEVLEGAEYVSFRIAESGTCDNFYDPGSDNFMLNDACIYVVFDGKEPSIVASVVIRFSRSEDSATYYFNVFKPYYHLGLFIEPKDIHYDEEQYIGISAPNQCNSIWPNPHDEILYNAELVQGQKFGELWNYDTGIHGDMLDSLYHFDGFTGFYFVANDSIPTKNTKIVIKVWMNDENVEPIFVSFFVMPPLILEAKAAPPKVKPSETSQLSFMYRESDGTLNAFSDYQLFNVFIDSGEEYGSIISEYDCDTAKAFYYSPGPFRFLASDSIDGESTTVRIIVETVISGGDASKINSNEPDIPENVQYNVPSKNGTINKLSRLNKTSIAQNNLNIVNHVTTLRDTIDIIVSKKEGKIFYVKASFDKDTLYAGDIANVILTRIDEEGNESNFPEPTLFEVGLIEGCDVGKIKVNGNEGEFFSDVKRPIMFIVNDTLTVDSARVILRAGVNSDDSTTYLPYISASVIEHNNEVPASAKIVGVKSVKEAKETCSTQQVQTDGFDDAVAEVESGGCDKYPCATNDPPQAPKIWFDSYNDIKLCNNSDYGYTALFPKKNLVGYYFVETCYDTSRNQWRINYSPDNMVHINYNYGICDHKIQEKANGKTIIYNPSEVLIKAKGNLIQAKNDFKCLKMYGVLGVDYLYYQMFVLHEEQHKIDLINMVDSLYKFYKFDEKFISKSIKCSDVKSYNDAKKKAELFVSNLIDNFKNLVLICAKTKFDDDFADYEMKTQRIIYKKLLDIYKSTFSAI